MSIISHSFESEKKERLDVILREKLPLLLKQEISNSKIRRFIVSGSVAVNGKTVAVPSYSVFKGSVIAVNVDVDKLLYEKKPDDVDFALTEKDVLYEDEFLICVNKPAFLPTEETIVQGRKSLHSCVIEYLWSKNPSLRNPPYAGIMHRLDRETSGVVLFTKSRQANKSIQQQFAEHSLKKIYIALCSGDQCPDPFSVKKYIGRISRKSEQCKMGLVSKERGGDYSETDFKILERNAFGKKIIRVECLLHTGRTHQIRLHLSVSGMPIVGDELYGSNVSLPQYNNRIMLHAEKLEFIHPITGKQVSVKAPVPF